MYNYYEEMKNDINSWLAENLEMEDFDTIYGILFDENIVTGNASGSYTMDRETAKEYVCDNINILNEMWEDGVLENDLIAYDFLQEAWEDLDVRIRCYLLYEVLSDIFKDRRYKL